MIAYKFLADGGVGRFSGFRWPQPPAGAPGPWIEAAGPLDPCLDGVHACALDRLTDWIDDELWLVELAGEIREDDGILLAERGRLVRQVETWTAEAALAFAGACAERAREQAFRALRRHGLTPEAEELVVAVAAVPGNAAAFAVDAAGLVHGRRPDVWQQDGPAGSQSPGATAANLGFVVAHGIACDAVEATGEEAAYGPAFAAERAWQAEWLATRLELS